MTTEALQSQQWLLESLKQCYTKRYASDMECIVCSKPATKIVTDKHSDETNYFCTTHFEELDND